MTTLWRLDWHGKKPKIKKEEHVATVDLRELMQRGSYQYGYRYTSYYRSEEAAERAVLSIMRRAEARAEKDFDAIQKERRELERWVSVQQKKRGRA